MGQLSKTLYSALLEELNGAHFRIAATNVSANQKKNPFVRLPCIQSEYCVRLILLLQFSNTMIITKNADGTFHYSGYAVDACQYMAELFHFKYVFYTSWYI